MAEGSATERTTGGKEAGGIPGVRQAAVARMASANPALKGLTGSTVRGPRIRERAQTPQRPHQHFRIRPIPAAGQRGTGAETYRREHEQTA